MDWNENILRNKKFLLKREERNFNNLLKKINRLKLEIKFIEMQIKKNKG